MTPFKNYIQGKQAVWCASTATMKDDILVTPELRNTAEQFPQLINGELRPVSSMVIPVINPATELPFACAPDATQSDLDDAIKAAKAAFPSWSQLSYHERVEYLERFADNFKAEAKDIAEVLTKEQGKPFSNALAEIHGAAGRVADLVSDGPLETEVLYEDDSSRTEIQRVPFGVVAAITPWNFPVLIAVSKLASALLTGNTVVVKPSPYTPLSTLMLANAAVKAKLPSGVLNIISGGDSLGRALAEHPDIRHISFTGSVATGKKVMRSASEMLKRVTLELGGNDAAIVLDDVDVTKAAEKIFKASMLNTGQVCTAIKRLYVHDSVYEDIVVELKNQAKKVHIGDGMEKGVTHGPLNNAMQLSIVKELLEDAKENGANLVCGGEPPSGRGYFFPPTLVTDIKEGVRLVDEEQFGPVLPIMRFSDIDDVIERVNASPYGLGGSVWTSDPEKGAQIASRLETGVTWVNAHITGDFRGKSPPFGGAKMSGIGREHGRAGLEEYTDLKTIRVAKKL